MVGTEDNATVRARLLELVALLQKLADDTPAGVIDFETPPKRRPKSDH
jgi:hypothetical protein